MIHEASLMNVMRQSVGQSVGPVFATWPQMRGASGDGFGTRRAREH
jgi:hypothetical protein